MEPETLYYLASPEAAQHIAAFFDALDAYKAECRRLGDSVGATNSLTLQHRVVGFEFKGKPFPVGWKSPPKHRHFPKDCAVWPKGWDASLPPFPDKRGLDRRLGIGEIEHRTYIRDGRLYGSTSNYGYEKAGDSWVIEQLVVDGKPHGNPPAGCKQLKKSEYYALKGE
jgi:hypothetical protein